jgi:hypothetical protein
MSQLTWKLELTHYRANAVSELGTYRIQGGPDQRWVALFIPFESDGSSGLSDVFTSCNFATLHQAIKSCVDHAERCVRTYS